VAWRLKPPRRTVIRHSVRFIDTLPSVRWLTFIVFAYLMLGLQTGLGALADVGPAWVNFPLIAAVFIAVNARRDPALIACFVLGLLHDLLGESSLGVYALAYCLVAWLIEGTDRALSPDHPFTHFVMTLFGGGVTAVVVYLQGHLALSDAVQPVPFWPLLATAFYSACVAVPALWAVGKFRKRFKFRRQS
jgi:rod shape-determining protein MreD